MNGGIRNGTCVLADTTKLVPDETVIGMADAPPPVPLSVAVATPPEMTTEATSVPVKLIPVALPTNVPPEEIVRLSVNKTAFGPVLVAVMVPVVVRLMTLPEKT